MSYTYIRHRDRMVQDSVFEDLKNTLIACRWMAGTTSRPVRDPAKPNTFDPVTGVVTVPVPEVITTDPSQILSLLRGKPVVPIDYFPDAEGSKDRSAATEKNTLAMDTGQPSDPEQAELGSPLVEQEYVFNFAFYAGSDAIALAVLNDLRDRYNGRIVDGSGINLYDYNTAPDVVAVRMDVEAFHYARPDEQVAPHEVHMYFAELIITDYVGT